ncbi:MAG: sensor histidine kinase, partial [Verrucomicrobiota bacterium]
FRDRRTAEDFDLLVECPDEVEPILADKDAMLTAVSNLLENAYKYGGDDRKILLRAKPVNEGVWVEVEDFGEGIPKSERQKIFDRFYRGKHTAGPNSGGVGLGLSIVSFIMAKHGGRVELESEEGKGSVFKLLIPYA